MARIMSKGLKYFGKKLDSREAFLHGIGFFRKALNAEGSPMAKVLHIRGMFSVFSTDTLSNKHQSVVCQRKHVKEALEYAFFLKSSVKIYKLIIYHFTWVNWQSDRDYCLFLPQPLPLKRKSYNKFSFLSDNGREMGAFFISASYEK